MKRNKNKIVDERQERQSQRNGNVTYIVMLMMLCVFYVYQVWFLQRGFDYTWPEFTVLMTGCILKIVLDVRQGIVYTSMNAKTKLTVALYVSAALIFAVVLGIRNYMLYGFELWMIVLIIAPVFIGMLALFAITHFTFMKLSKKRLEKLERKLEDDDPKE
jgi:cytochrome c oxidase assembly factor CtaG